MPRWSVYALVLGCLVLASLACEESEPDSAAAPVSQTTTKITPGPALSKGDRILELDSNAPQKEDYDQVMELARELGVESIRLSVYWDDLETSPGVYQPDPNWLAIANQYYSSQGFSISLVISVLDTTEIRLPADLEGKSFSDPLLLERFQGLLDYVSTQLTDVNLVSLAIGNEIDGVLGSNQQDWIAFRDFYEPAADYARQLWPGVPVSTKVTFDGFTGPMAETARSMYREAEVVMTTYYPLNDDFSVKDPGVVVEDFQRLAEMFPDQTIHLTEIGYPTSAENGSSPEMQAEFIRSTFQAWDNHADQIQLLSYSWLHDLPQSSVRELENYYGLRDRAFGEFLRTLGLRTYDGPGENKIGFDTFQAEANARGW